MRHLYEIRSGDRHLAVREAPTPHAALLDFVRAQGYRDKELMRLGDASLSWRGAVFHAVAMETEDGGEPLAEREDASARSTDP